jgi:hypothetical protein
MQRTHVVRFDLRSLMFSMPCLTVLAQDLCYSDPLSLVLTFLTHTMAVRILSLVAALPSLCMLCMPLMFRSQQPQKNSHQSTSETQTQTQTHRHTDTQTHRHTDAQTHRHKDTQTRGEPWRPPPLPLLFSMCRSDTLTLSRRSCLPLSTLMRHWQVWSHHSCHQS